LTGDDLQTFINKLRLLSPLAYDEDFQEDMDDFDEFDDEEDMDELDEPLEESEEVQDPTEKSLENEIKELKDRNRALTEELYVSNARARKMEKELLVQKSNMDVLQRELADLRNIIFNSQTGEFGEEKEGHLQIDYPYTAKSNVVVFGGHDSWAKAIKPLFTNVRFIHKDASPSSDMIRNADIVWIQTNALAHANFYKIIDVVRANNVPVRYFAFASATKCAEQIIVNDMG